MGRQEDLRTLDLETARVRGIYERMAPRYNKMIAIWERLLLAGDRQWACGQATGEVLEWLSAPAATYPGIPRK